MANAFSKEEKVTFDELLGGFDGALVASRAAVNYTTDQTQMARTGDIIWRPQPYIMTSYSGNDMTSNFKDVTQLSVPVAINQQRSVPWIMSATDLRDAQQNGRLMEAAKQKLAFDMDVAVSDTAGLYGSLFVKRVGAATGFDDLAAADALMTSQGIPRNDRKCIIGPNDWNNMASTIAKPQTSANSNVNSAYERAMLPNIAGFDVFKADYVPNYAATAGVTMAISAYAGGLPASTVGYTPVAATLTAGVGSLNVDNRFQNVTITLVSGSVKVGDAFSITNAIAVNHGSKTTTGQAKTFRIVGIVSGGGTTGSVVTICPPVIPASGAGVLPSAVQYANVLTAPAVPAATTLLNNAVGGSFFNPFWQGDAMLIVPGRLAPAPDSGMAVMSGTTDQGFTLTLTRQGEINQLQTRYRVDAYFGAVCTQPEMAGVLSFGNT